MSTSSPAAASPRSARRSTQPASSTSNTTKPTTPATRAAATPSPHGGRQPLAEFLAGHDIIVNCVLQDTAAPPTFLIEEDLPTLAPGTLVIDVSCNQGMGFSWARPTTFTDPMFTVGNGVDHSPSYLWNSATWENSEAVIPFLRPVMDGPAAWKADQTIRRAIEIRNGIIQNPAILGFQHRSAQYPHLTQPV